jgi:hypothetical protein
MLAPYKTASKFWTETMIELPGVREDGMLGRNGQIGVHPSAFAVRDAAEIEHAIEEFAPGPNGGLIVLPNSVTVVHRGLIITLAAKRHLPAVYAHRVFATSGAMEAFWPRCFGSAAIVITVSADLLNLNPKPSRSENVHALFLLINIPKKPKHRVIGLQFCERLVSAFHGSVQWTFAPRIVFQAIGEWKRLDEGDPGVVDMETLLKGICSKKGLLDIVENFILFDDSAGQLVKIVSFLEEHNKAYVFSLIQKFNQRVSPGEPYSRRDDLIVVTDEAHRTQYGEFALNLRNALPNASYIGFTGTPLFCGDEITKRVFGGCVSRYNFQRAVEDGATVPLYYDARGDKLGVAVTDLNERIAQKLEQLEIEYRYRAAFRARAYA